MNTMEEKTVRLSSLKLRETFRVEGLNAQYVFMGAMQNAGEYSIENAMTGKRDVWLGRVMVSKLVAGRRGV